MKAGRPRYHVPAKWISVYSPRGVMYYELDSKGNIAKGLTEMCTPQPFNYVSIPEINDIIKFRKTKKEKEEHKEHKENIEIKPTKAQDQKNEKQKDDDDLLHIFENELSNDDIYHQDEGSFEIMNFFE